MNARTARNLKPESRLVYDDGRAGHAGVGATVIGTNDAGCMVQFDDRADSTFIGWADMSWWNHLSVEKVFDVNNSDLVGKAVVDYDYVEQREVRGLIVSECLGYLAHSDNEATIITIEWDNDVTTRHTLESVSLSAIAARDELRLY